jgi:ankyrin repeat protein
MKLTFILVAVMLLCWQAICYCDAMQDECEKLMTAATAGDLAEVKRIVSAHPSHIASTDSRGDTALHLASSNGHNGTCDFLLSSGADCAAEDSRGRTPLMLAALHGHLVTARALLAHGAVINAIDAHGFTPLHFAVLGGHQEFAEALVAGGSDIDARTSIETTIGADQIAYVVPAGSSALDIALIAKHTQMARCLRERGCH